MVPLARPTCLGSNQSRTSRLGSTGGRIQMSKLSTLQKILGLEEIKDNSGRVVQEAPLSGESKRKRGRDGHCGCKPSSPGVGTGFREETNTETAMQALKDESFWRERGYERPLKGKTQLLRGICQPIGRTRRSRRGPYLTVLP